MITRAGQLCLVGLLFMGGMAHSQTVTYSLASQTPLLEDSFYESGAGTAIFNTVVTANGSKVVFWAADWGTYTANLYVVDVGNPASVQLLYPTQSSDGYNPIDLSPDYTNVLTKDSATDRVLVNITTGQANLIGNVWFPGIAGDFTMSDGKFTHKASGNIWVQGNEVNGAGEITAIPVNPNGFASTTRTPIVLTNLGLPGISLPTISDNGNVIGFTVERAFGPGNPTEGDLYVMTGIPAIIAAPKIPGTDISSLAPTSLADPRIIAIRSSSESPGLWNGTPGFSNNNELIFYSVEVSEQFVTEEFPSRLPISDWDIFISNADGSGNDFQIAAPGNQAGLRPFPTGARFTVLQGGPGTPGPVDLRVYLTNVETANEFAPEQSDPLLEGGMTAEIDGSTVDLPFMLTDHAVQTTAPVAVVDAAGTSIDLPAQQVINFPPGSTQNTISISTPIAPVQQAQLPSNAFISAIPVVREFGPVGTQFYPPIPITITYSDDEIFGLDEGSITPYLFNEDTGIFDIPVPEEDIIFRDLANNQITFVVDHFSMYGLGFLNPTSIPASSSWGLAMAIAGIACMGSVALFARRREGR